MVPITLPHINYDTALPNDNDKYTSSSGKGDDSKAAVTVLSFKIIDRPRFSHIRILEGPGKGKDIEVYAALKSQVEGRRERLDMCYWLL